MPLARLGRGWPVLVAVLFALVGITWGLPGSDTWAEDAMSPRTCGLFGIAETYTPGHFHAYPPLHVALLTLTSLPWEIATIARVGLDRAALERALIEPRVMTPVELCARLVAVAMLAGIVWNTVRLFERLGGRRVGIVAGLVVATDSALLYYAHTGALEVPYLFWSSWALVEIDRVLAGESREPQVMIAVTCAVLTKDQAAGLFLLTLPACLAVRPALLRSKRTWLSLGGALVAYALVAGAVTNPSGFAKRIALLLGPMATDWTPYPRTLAGYGAMARDAFFAVPLQSSWLIAVASGIGIAVAAGALPSPPAPSPKGEGEEAALRTRRMMPLLAAASYTLCFLLGARRTEDRFLLPLAILVFPYAAFALETWLSRARSAVLPYAAFALALVPAVLAVASLDATLLADPRYAAERFLASLPAGTRIEVYGGSHFIPRIPAQLDAVRVSLDDPAERSHTYRVADVQGDPNAIDLRHPGYVVLGAEHSHLFPPGYAPTARYGTVEFTDPATFRFFYSLTENQLDYAPVLKARCELPWPLSCRDIHGSTGHPIWIYRRNSPEKPATE
jgi:hypothetical protein